MSPALSVDEERKWCPFRGLKWYLHWMKDICLSDRLNILPTCRCPYSATSRDTISGFLTDVITSHAQVRTHQCGVKQCGRCKFGGFGQAYEPKVWAYHPKSRTKLRPPKTEVVLSSLTKLLLMHVTWTAQLLYGSNISSVPVGLIFLDSTPHEKKWKTLPFVFFNNVLFNMLWVTPKLLPCLRVRKMHKFVCILYSFYILTALWLHFESPANIPRFVLGIQ